MAPGPRCMRLAPGVWWYAGPLAVATVPAFFVSIWAGLAMGCLLLCVLGFYRDPTRSPPPSGIVAPADGRVSVIREENGRLRVGIFMNVYDVHVNRAPMAGTVTAVEHSPGAHRPAFSKNSDRNERLRIDFGAEGFTVILIAGAFARRITPYVEEHTSVERGERIGHIAFGSRVDLLCPPSIDRGDLRVDVGDRTTAGETVVSRQPGPVEFDP